MPYVFQQGNLPKLDVQVDRGENYIVVFLALDKVSTPTIKVYISVVYQLHMSPPLISDMAMLAQVIQGIKITQASEPASHQHNTPALLRESRQRGTRVAQDDAIGSIYDLLLIQRDL